MDFYQKQAYIKAPTAITAKHSMHFIDVNLGRVAMTNVTAAADQHLLKRGTVNTGTMRFGIGLALKVHLSTTTPRARASCPLLHIAPLSCLQRQAHLSHQILRGVNSAWVSSQWGVRPRPVDCQPSWSVNVMNW